MLGEYGDDNLLNKYKEFYRIRAKIKTKCIIQTPSPTWIDETIEKLNIILNYQENLKWVDDFVKRRNEKQSLVYGNEKYIVLMPASVQEVIDEALARNIHLINFLVSFINGGVNILFLRRASHMNEPYVSLIVSREGLIQNVFDQDGRLPSKSVIEFLEKRYSKAMGFKINPWNIITCALEDIDFTEEYTDQQLQELRKYAFDYKIIHGFIEESEYMEE